MNRESQQVTMYIKNRRKSNKFKGFGSHQTLCLTESFVLRNRLIFIHQTSDCLKTMTFEFHSCPPIFEKNRTGESQRVHLGF
jgi:hypothetical protein